MAVSPAGGPSTSTCLGVASTLSRRAAAAWKGGVPVQGVGALGLRCCRRNAQCDWVTSDEDTERIWQHQDSG